MAIVVDATAAGVGTSGTSLTWSHTCTGNNRILFVGCGLPLTDIVTGVTYNGVAMTLAKKVQITGDRWLYLFYLTAPATGANNVVVSMSSSDVIRGASVSYTGASQGALDATASNVGNSSSLTVNLTTTADNCWLIGVADGASTITAGANTFDRVDWNPSGGQANVDSNGAKTPPGSYSLNVTAGASTNWGMVGASFSPPIPPPTFKGFKTLLGVGQI